MNITKFEINFVDKTLTINLTSNSRPTYIYIDTEKTFNCINGPSDIAKLNKIAVQNITQDQMVVTTAEVEDDPQEQEEQEEQTETEETEEPVVNTNSYYLSSDQVIDLSDYDLDNNLLFVFIETENIEYKSSYFFNETTFYKGVFNTIHKTITGKECCNFKGGVCDLLVLYEAFKLADTMHDYKKMVYYWNKLHKSGLSTLTRNCNCNG